MIFTVTLNPDGTLAEITDEDEMHQLRMNNPRLNVIRDEELEEVDR